MARSVIERVRESGVINYCYDNGLPISTTRESLESTDGNKWTQYYAGFVAGVQLGLRISREIREGDFKLDSIESALIDARFLPDGP